ncbi:DUF2306 domain-containing protein [Qipengyuania aquimaris]|uniref:DUF2306 domain-containing protein n=1 Tax=Qipengyuania aquimaris TaxID=255984 RepID=A0A9Q3S2T7_9SPHN|nr:hypothetical protein [Qipengyuania aquimaris]MBY6218790.1 hypothetical protein [Qipengyuania aquimaris]
MTALSLPNHLLRRSGPMDITPITRALVIGVGGAMTAVCIFAIARALLGFTSDLPHLSNVAVAFHVTTVLPCVPLGVYLLLARKGTPRHKQLGKLWIVLMVITATSTLFIHDGMRLSWIHIFVPITYRASWLIVSSARKGDMMRHRKEIISLFFGALMIPGIAAIALPGRLMNVMLFG